MGKTKAVILEEKLKEKELESYQDNIDVEKIKALTELLNAHVPDGDNWVSPFNQKGNDIITAKVIEIVKRL